MMSSTSIGHRRWLLHVALACGSIAAGRVAVIVRAGNPGRTADRSRADARQDFAGGGEHGRGAAEFFHGTVGRFPPALHRHPWPAPQPQELQDFLKDSSPQAYGKAVDRLMARQLLEEKEKKKLTRALLKLASEDLKRVGVGIGSSE